MIRLAGVLALLLQCPALAHDAPSGWSYSAECCGVRDCHPIRDLEVEPEVEGWRIVATGEVIPFNDRRIKKSQDEHFHRCEAASGMTRCLYVPTGV